MFFSVVSLALAKQSYENSCLATQVVLHKKTPVDPTALLRKVNRGFCFSKRDLKKWFGSIRLLLRKLFAGTATAKTEAALEWLINFKAKIKPFSAFCVRCVCWMRSQNAFSFCISPAASLSTIAKRSGLLPILLRKWAWLTSISAPKSLPSVLRTARLCITTYLSISAAFVTDGFIQTRRLMARFTGGWFSMERRLLVSDIGKDANLYCIWATLISWANIQESTAKFGGKPIRLKVGELVTSHDELAKQWHFSHSVVKRCLNYLKMSERIDLRSSSRGTHIKVLNYSKYQDGDRSRRQRSARESANNELTTDLQSSSSRLHMEQGNKELSTNKQGESEKNSLSVKELIWSSYSEGFKQTYGFNPSRKKTDDAYLIKLSEELGNDAPGIVNLYAVSKRDYWLQRTHSLDVCLQDVNQVRAAYAQKRKPEAVVRNDADDLDAYAKEASNV